VDLFCCHGGRQTVELWNCSVVMVELWTCSAVMVVELWNCSVVMVVERL